MMKSLSDLLPPVETWYNMLVMSIMWTVCSFSSFLLSYQLKYIEGDIFRNAYCTYLSDLVACVLGGFMYQKIGMQSTFGCAFFCASLGIFYILIIEYIADPVNYDVIPSLLLLIKFGLTIGFLATYQASFHDDIFPQSHRSTAIALCNIIARAVTILAP